MKIKYRGPRSLVIVAGFGPHYKNEIRDYPDEAAEKLLATSFRQRFEAVEPAEKKPTEKKKPEKK